MKGDEISVSTWKFQALGWIGLVFCSFMAVGVAVQGPWFLGVLTLPFIAASGAMALLSGRITASPEGIQVTTIVGPFAMRWSEIQSIRIGQGAVVFSGQGKRLVIPHPSYWSGKDRWRLRSSIRALIAAGELDAGHAHSADYLLPRNTRNVALTNSLLRPAGGQGGLLRSAIRADQDDQLLRSADLPNNGHQNPPHEERA